MYALRAMNSAKGLAKISLVSRLAPSLSNPMSRSLVYASLRSDRDGYSKHPTNCTCCSSFVSKAKLHTNADKDLSVYLDKEIVLEQNQVKAPKGALRIPGFDVTEDGSNLVLHRKFKNEKIRVRLNVNASVDPEEPPMPLDYDDKNPDSAQMSEMKSKPDFSVEITKPNGKTLVLSCSFYRGPPEDMEDPEGAQQVPEKTDAFQIDNFFIVENGESLNDKNLKDNIYMGDGELIDGEMYDLLMNYLDDRGVTNEFAENLIDYCTNYEHNQYINLLSNLKSFLAQ